MAVALVAALVITACGQAPPEEEAGFTDELEEALPAEPDMPDTLQIAPPGSRVVYADPMIEMAHLTMLTGDTIPEHPLPSAVLYALTDAEVRMTQDGNEVLLKMAPNEARALEPATYSFANASDMAVDLLLISRGEAPLPQLQATLQGFGPLEPEHGTVRLKNDWIRVVEMRLPPGESLPLDPVALRLWFTRLGATLSIQAPGEQADVLDLDPGTAEARTGPDVGLTNTAESPTTVVLFELRAPAEAGV